MTSPFSTPFPYQGASSCPGRHLGHPGPHGKGSLQRPSLTCVPPKNPLSRARCSARQRPWSCSWSSSSAHKPAPLMDNKVCPYSHLWTTCHRCPMPAGLTWAPKQNPPPEDTVQLPPRRASEDPHPARFPVSSPAWAECRQQPLFPPRTWAQRQLGWFPRPKQQLPQDTGSRAADTKRP